jgi:HEAT repeat protein
MQRLLAIGLIATLAAPAAAFDGPTKDEVTKLVKDLKDNNPSVRTKAARALEKLDPAAKDAIPVLIEALKEQQDVTIPPIAARALARQGSAAVPALIEALEIKDGRVQAYAAKALKQIGPDAKQAAPALIEVVKKHKDPTHVARLEAIAALGKIGPAAKDAVPTLIEATKEKPPTSPVRLVAVAALGQIGPDAKEAVPTLINLLGEEENKSGPVRIEAAKALGLIGSAAGREASAALVALVENKQLGPSRIVAINALAQLGPEAKNAVPALKKAAEDTELKDAATKALEKLEGKK